MLKEIDQGLFVYIRIMLYIQQVELNTRYYLHHSPITFFEYLFHNNLTGKQCIKFQHSL